MKKAGIYKIINKQNNKYYIGSTSCFRTRKASHKYNLRHNKHQNIHLQRTWNQLGEINFDFKFIEEIKFKSEDTSNYKSKVLNNREQWYLDQILTKDKTNINHDIAYNIDITANHQFHSQEAKDKLKKLTLNRYKGKDNPRYLDLSEHIPFIIEQYNKQISLKKIGKSLNCSFHPIKRILLEQGIVLRTQGETKKGKISLNRKFTKQDIVEIKKLNKEGMLNTDIAKLKKCCKGTIGNIINNRTYTGIGL